MFTMDMKIAGFDSELNEAMKNEIKRQEEHVELIASENYASPRVLEAQGSLMTNKYAEGYPGKRYYGGCENVDVAEQLAIDRLKELYGADYANVQPHSGSQANAAVYLALLKPGDTILGMSLDAGGHLTHGAKVNFSGKIFNAIQYGINEDGLIDYDEVERLANEHKPKMLIGGFSAYSQIIDWKRMSEIAKSVGAYFHVDMAHVSGLVAAGVYPNPVPFADVVTSTTHKTLRGPRGGIIICKSNEELEKKFNSLVFPGTQGGPLMHVIAARAVCFGEALKPEFEEYIKNVIASAKVMAKTLVDRGFRIVTGGTDSHIVWLDLTPKGLTGDKAEKILEEVGLACNKNAIPYDPNPPKITSGLRFGTAAATTRGFNQKDFEQVGNMIADILDSLLLEENERNVVFNKTRKDVIELCKKYPIYSEAF